MVRRRLLGLLLLALSSSGCGPAVEPLGTELAPRAEALSYFPPGAPAVAVISTKGAGPQALLTRLLELRGRTITIDDLRPVLGREVVVGIARAGASPLGVVVTRRRDAPTALGDRLVARGRATGAGRYRGATLFAAGDRLALAAREGVLLVAPSTRDLRAALDHRAEGEGLDEPTWRLGLPRAGTGERPVARATFDLRVLTARASPRLRAVPFLSAAGRVGAVVRATDGGLVADVRLDTRGGDLVERDVPVSPGARAPLAIPVPEAGVALSVRDLAHLLGVAREAAAAGLPIEFLRYLRARAELARSGGSNLEADVVARLHGPATILRTADGVALVARPSRPRELRVALRRILRRAPRALERAGLPGVTVSDLAGSRLVSPPGTPADVRRVSVGMVGDVLVAGTLPAEELRALALTRPRRAPGARGGLAFEIGPEALADLLPSGLADLLAGARVDGWLRGETTRTTGRLRLAF